MPKSVLITGCSVGGIGYALAKTLQKHGLIVFATARNTAKMSGLKSLEGVHLLSLDVTNPASIAAAVKEVEAKTGKLDYLFNNSGQSYIIPMVDADIEEAKKLFDVNVWGVLRTVQSFLPLLIEAKGTIVTIGSGSGLVHLPYTGNYST
jgi:1-acylglycerone phosphate reductase